MRDLVTDMASLQGSGSSFVLVSSGAIGAGMEAMGWRKRPTTIPDLQLAAAVGQSRLMSIYDTLFLENNCRTAQMLLTHDDLKHRQRHLNARNTLMNLISHDIIPVINENDAVAVDEIKVGDNDWLAALVSLLISAELLIILTNTNGVREPAGNQRTRKIPLIENLTEELLVLTRGKGDPLATGGMISKLQAAHKATSMGIPVVIADGSSRNIIQRILAGDDVGTVVARPTARGTGGALDGRKQWIAFFHKPQGSLIIDAGARQALCEDNKSLLPIGVTKAHGDFPVGALVEIRDRRGNLIGQGLTDYSSDDIRRIKGKRSSEIANILGNCDYDEVVRRDNLVVDPENL